MWHRAPIIILRRKAAQGQAVLPFLALVQGQPIHGQIQGAVLIMPLGLVPVIELGTAGQSGQAITAEALAEQVGQPQVSIHTFFPHKVLSALLAQAAIPIIVPPLYPTGTTIAIKIHLLLPFHRPS